MLNFTRDLDIARTMKNAVEKIALPNLSEEFLKAALDEPNLDAATAMINAIKDKWQGETINILGHVRSEILRERKNLSPEKWSDGFTVPRLEQRANFCGDEILKLATPGFVSPIISALIAHEAGPYLARPTVIKHIKTLESVVSRLWDITESNDDEKYTAPKQHVQAPMQLLFDMAPALSWFVERGYGPGAVRPVANLCDDPVLKAKASARYDFLAAVINDWERSDRQEPVLTPQGRANSFREFFVYVP